jgi:hypothetical protein
MEKGERVRVTEFGGIQTVRRVVQEGDVFVIVCSEQEYAAATKEGREPEGVGFPKRSISTL